MIWFACKQCGKHHQQPPAASGSLIFCECGQANRVPWESTVPESRERDRDEPSRRRSDEEREPERRGRRRRRREPTYCLNHEDAPLLDQCADCGEGFCERCLVDFQGLHLCGPCKNFRVRKLQRLPRVTGLTIAALVVGLCSAPVIFCLTMIPIGNRNPQAIIPFGLMGAVIGGAAVVLGLLGLRDAENKTARGGQGMAMIGAALGTAGLLWSLSLVVVVAHRVFSG